MPETFPAARRIRRRPEFQRAYEKGRRIHGRFMTVFFLRADVPQSRLGVSATRKLGGAVVRNRAKRRFREAFRRGQFPAGVDIVVIPRPAALEAPFGEVAAELQLLVARAARAVRSGTATTPGRDA